MIHPKLSLLNNWSWLVLVDNDDDDLNLQGHAAHTRGDSSLPSGQSGIPSHTWWMMMMMMVTMMMTMMMMMMMMMIWTVRQ